MRRLSPTTQSLPKLIYALASPMRLIENGDSSLPRNEASAGSEPQLQLCGPLSELFPGTTQVRLVGLSDASDRAIWEYAKRNGFYVVSLDSDFSEMSALLGPPPKIIWLRCGNQPTAVIEKLLRSHADVLEQFDMDSASACIEIY